MSKSLFALSGKAAALAFVAAGAAAYYYLYARPEAASEALKRARRTRAAQPVVMWFENDAERSRFCEGAD